MRTFLVGVVIALLAIAFSDTPSCAKRMAANNVTGICIGS